MKAICLLMVVGLLCGCSKGGAPEAETKKALSTAQTLVNGFTGRTAVNAGQKAKADITRISEEHNRDLDAIME